MKNRSKFEEIMVIIMPIVVIVSVPVFSVSLLIYALYTGGFTLVRFAGMSLVVGSIGFILMYALLNQPNVPVHKRPGVGLSRSLAGIPVKTKALLWYFVFIGGFSVLAIIGEIYGM